MSTPLLALENVSRHYRTEAGIVRALDGVSLNVERGQTLGLVGESGCGKSTVARVAMRLTDVDQGEVRLDGADIATARGRALDAIRPRMQMVFQDPAASLNPRATIGKTLEAPLIVHRRGNATARKARVSDMLRKVGLHPDMARRFPHELSGGQRQRVAIGRAIVREPRLFLFDEPLSNLDAELRVQMRVELAKLHKALGVTMVYVTHDQVEAMTMADRIVVMRGGVVEQVGRPLELYNRPANRFVAGFIGSPKMNFLDLGDRSISADFPDGRHAITIGVRPEHLRIDGDADVTIGRAIPQIVEHLGGSTIVHAKLEDGQSIAIELDGQRDVARGEALVLGARIDNCHFFDARGAVVLPVGT